MNISELPIIPLRPFNPYEAAQMEIDANFERYGIFPKCADCDRSLICGQPNVPTLKIIFCEKDRADAN